MLVPLAHAPLETSTDSLTIRAMTHFWSVILLKVRESQPKICCDKTQNSLSQMTAHLKNKFALKISQRQSFKPRRQSTADLLLKATPPFNKKPRPGAIGQGYVIML
jgi:hypothetical protein